MSCLLRLKQYLAANKAPCSRIEHSDSTGGESQTSNRSISNLMFYRLSHCAPTKFISKDSWNLWHDGIGATNIQILTKKGCEHNLNTTVMYVTIMILCCTNSRVF